MCPLLSTQKYGSELCCDLIEADQFHASNTFFSEIRAGIIPDFFFSCNKTADSQRGIGLHKIPFWGCTRAK